MKKEKMPGTHASLYPMSKPDQGIIMLERKGKEKGVKEKKKKQIASQFFEQTRQRQKKEKEPLKKNH